MAFFLNALRSRWRHRYSVEDLSPQEPVHTVSCISLTDLSDKKVRPVSVFSEPGSFVLDKKPRGSKRPLSSASQLSWNVESELKAEGSSLSISDGGYSSMNESLESLSRTDSIQNRSLRIWRKRRPWLVKKHQLTGQESDSSMSMDKGSSENILERVEETSNENVVEENNLPKTRPRSVHFDTSLSDLDDDDKENTETNNGYIGSVSRQSSIRLKSWQIRRQRRALKKKSERSNRRSGLKLNELSHELSHEHQNNNETNPCSSPGLNELASERQS